MKKCPKCSKEVGKNDSFCPGCGLDLKNSVIEDDNSLELEKEKNLRVMRKLSHFTIDELLKKGVSRDKIGYIKVDLKREFLEGNLNELPILLKECAFQTYVKTHGEKRSAKRNIKCLLAREDMVCMKDICPLFKI